MERHVRFNSDGLELAGVLHTPNGRDANQRLPAFLVLHGFMGSKDESHAEIQARMLCDFGYAALRFDMRGCGDSGGRRGYVLCMDQVADTQPTELFLITGVSHFPLAGDGFYARDITKRWLDKFFPVNTEASGMREAS